MRTLCARLPRDRAMPGTVWLEDEGRIIAGPYPCRGKADNHAAVRHGNPSRDPTRPYGDHRSGEYLVRAIVADKGPADAYGPYFILVDPVGGPTLTADELERAGFAIHGGRPTDTGGLRATYGCLRMYDFDLVDLVPQLEVGMAYSCIDVEVV